MKKHFKEKKSIATKHSKSYLVGAGIFLLASTLIGGTIYATISSKWTPTNTLEATANTELTSSSWNNLLGNLEFLYENKADVVSPNLTGTPKAPTPAFGTNTTQIATAAFVQNAVNSKANTESPALTGIPTAPTAGNGTSNTQIATTAFVQNSLSSKANLASPALTGIPTAPTAGVGTSNTQIATTAFVQAAIQAALGSTSSSSGGGSLDGGYFCNGKYRAPLGTGTMTLTNATTGCNGMGIGWYLPSKDQLVSLAGQSCKSNAIGGYSTSYSFRSSTNDGGYPTIVRLSDGSNGPNYTYENSYTICVHN